MLTNEAAGKIVVEICGKQVPLALTLGAISFMEKAWDAQDMEGVFKRMATMRTASDVLVVLQALSNGALTEQDVGALNLNDIEKLRADFERVVANALPETAQGNAKRASA